MRSDHDDERDDAERSTRNELFGRKARCLYMAAGVVVCGSWLATWAFTIAVAWVLGVDAMSTVMALYRMVLYVLLLYALAWHRGAAGSVLYRLTMLFYRGRRR